MYQQFTTVLKNGVLNTYDGRLVAIGQPEPKFLQRRYEQAQALRELRREERVRQLAGDDAPGLVDRIRMALGIA